MKQENKQLLLKDLCARLPYGVMCQVDDGAAGLNDGKPVEIDISKELVRFDADYYWDAYIDDIKPYLRPMSSMTKQEKEDYEKLCNEDIRQLTEVQELHPGLKNKTSCHRSIDWLLSHHFDYRRLIEKDLALETPEGMYK